jgi:hypothetical protein
MKILSEVMMKCPPFTYEGHHYKGMIVKVVDPSQTWVRNSPVPWYQVVDSWQDLRGIYNDMTQSCVFDISRLYPFEQRLFIAQLVGSDFTYLMNKRNDWWINYLLEESHMVVPSGSLRALYAQETMRTITVGRNYGQSVGLITQFPATVDTNAIKACGQAYFGLAWEENDLRKLRNFTGWKKRKAENIFKNLQTGQFVYLITGRNSSARIINTPEFNDGETMQPTWAVAKNAPKPKRGVSLGNILKSLVS